MGPFLAALFCLGSCGGGDPSLARAAPAAPGVSRPAFWYDLTGRFVLTGRVNANGLPTQAWFEWGPDPDLAVRSVSPENSVDLGMTSRVLEHPLAAVAPGVPVYYRLAARNDAGVTRGPVDRIVPSRYTGRDNVATTALTFELDLTVPPTVTGSLGTYQVDEVADHSLVFNGTAGNLCDSVLYDRATDNFNYDGLYKVSTGGGEYYFRFGNETCSGGRTKFVLLNWANNARPPGPGAMTFDIVRKDIRQTGTQEFSTVGDSITWAFEGESYRKRLSRRNSDLRFIGSRTDIFGFGHEGEGANATSDVLVRMGWILPSANYLLLIGTNDRILEAQTVANIQAIVAALLKKRDGNRVYVMTILPKVGDNDARNRRVNERLREWHARTSDERIRLVDAERTFRALPDWPDLMPDGTHPDANGYMYLAETIDNNLQ